MGITIYELLFNEHPYLQKVKSNITNVEVLKFLESGSVQLKFPANKHLGSKFKDLLKGMLGITED